MESIGIGLVIVSHSKHIAEGVVELISKVAKDVPITYVGGTEGGGIGTSFDQVDRVVSENPADTLLVFFDLGSAKMNLKMVTDFSDKSIIINRVPIVEGAYNAAALLQAGAELSVIQIQLPDALFYEKIGQQIAGFSKEKTLMIGDSLTADIQGGNNAGIDTIWYNPHHLENHTQAQPTYEVYSYQDLLDCLDKNILEKITF